MLADLEKTAYPAEIYIMWETALAEEKLSPDSVERILSVVQYAQPPLAVEALEKAQNFYEQDIKENDLRDELIILRKSAEVTQNSPRAIAKLYPVYYALTNDKFLGKTDCLVASAGRKLISNIFSKDIEVENSSRDTLYNHVLSVRHITMAVMVADFLVTKEVTSPAEYFQEAINSDKLFNRTLELREPLIMFSLLIHNRLAPGQKRRNGGGCGRGFSDGKDNLAKRDSWHEDRVKSLIETPPPTRLKINAEIEADGSDRDIGSGYDDFSRVGLHSQSTPQNGNHTEEIPERIVLQRREPSLLSARDDTQMARRWATGAATASLPSVSDMHRLIPEKVDAIMALPMPPLAYLFAVLLLCTGMPVNRLRHIVVSSDSDCPEGDTPIWHPDTQALLYRLKGPYRPEEQNRCIALSLPQSLAQPLLDSKIAQPGVKPFQRIRQRLDALLRRHLKHCPGIMPTATRLCATSWLIRRPFAHDDCAAGTIAGELDQSLAAPSVYRQISQREVQEIFESSINHVTKHALEGIDKTNKGNSEDNYHDKSQGIIGSNKVQPAKEFRLIFSSIRDDMREPALDILTWYKSTESPLGSLIKLFQLVACHNLLAWQLSTGARPIGPSSKNALGDRFQWIYDKDSAYAAECRTVPLLPSIRDDIAAFHLWTERVITRLMAFHVRITDRRKATRDTPFWMELHRNSLVISDMTWSDMKSSSVVNLSELPSNCARHSVATHLRSCVPESHIDLLLGHARNGQTLTAPRAMNGIGAATSLRKELKQWLSECGYRPLKWEELPWNS